MTRNEMVFEGIKVKAREWYDDENRFSDILFRTDWDNRDRSKACNQAIENFAEQCCDMDDEELDNEELLKDNFERCIRLATCIFLASEYKEAKKALIEKKALIRNIEGNDAFDCVEHMEKLED